MKPRKVVVTIELETDERVEELKAIAWCSYEAATQVQVNVIQPAKRAKSRRQRQRANK